MRRADTGSVVTVEVFVEEDVVAEMRIVLILALTAEYGPVAVFPAEKQACQASRQLGRNAAEIHEIAGTGGELDLKVVAVVVIELLQRLDEEVVHGKPDRSAPVGVTAEEAGGGFGRLIIDAILFAVHWKYKRLVPMKLR